MLCSASFFLLMGKMRLVYFFYLIKVVVFTPTAKEKHLITVSCVFYGVMWNCDCGLFRVAYPAPLWQWSSGIFLYPWLVERKWCKIWFFLSFFLYTNMCLTIYKIYYSCSYFICSPKIKQYHTHERKRRLRYSHSFVYIQTKWRGCDCDIAII